VSAFQLCDALTSVTIENGVTRIGETAFNGCNSLPGIIIPPSVTHIGNAAFANCVPSLASVTFQGTIAPANISRSAFGTPAAGNSIGDLRDKYPAGGPGTYTTSAPVSNSSVWTKQANTANQNNPANQTSQNNTANQNNPANKTGQNNPANPANQTRQADSYTTTLSGANLYADHSSNSRVIKTIKAGETVAVRQTTTAGNGYTSSTPVTFTESGGRTWYFVEHGGSEGWVSSEHLSLK